MKFRSQGTKFATGVASWMTSDGNEEKNRTFLLGEDTRVGWRELRIGDRASSLSVQSV
ncbi:MAG: hypothetical protein KatS3mg105_3739 [Gemmatales bacterium]|nr:MAG: hypothetical protein KatS3mg105_3739 [Gemmatales bacterium]